MAEKDDQRMWIAVRIIGGFPVKVKGFKKEKSAVKQERRWRKKMRPDYDETGVLQMKIPHE